MPSRRSIANEEDWGDQPALFDTSVEIFRYLIVISPSQEMIGEIAQLKQKIFEAIGTYRGDRSIAHMTLLFAYLPIEYEAALVEGIGKGVDAHRSMELQYEGFHHFPDRSGIFIEPMEKAPVIELQRSIRQDLQGDKRLKRLGIHPTTQPMIHIARKLKPGQFDPAWLALAPHEFDRSEVVDEVILLRSGLKEGEKYLVIGKFPIGAK